MTYDEEAEVDGSMSAGSVDSAVASDREHAASSQLSGRLSIQPAGQEAVPINLTVTFSKLKNIKILLKKLALDNEKMLNNLYYSKSPDAKNKGTAPEPWDASENQEEKKILRQLVSFQCKNDSRVEEFVQKSSAFLDYLFSEHSALFVFQQTYCMTDAFEFCPAYFNEYVTQLQQVLTTVPLRFSVLGDKFDDGLWSQLQSREFTYNRFDPCHLLLS